MSEDVTVLCTANLYPTSFPVLETLDRDPSGDNCREWSEGREATRQVLAEFLHASPVHSA